MPTIRLAQVLVLAGVVAVGGLGCSKAEDGVTAGTTQPVTVTTTATGAGAAAGGDAASAGGAKASCDPAALVPVIQQKYGAAGVDHLVCLVPNAMLTVKTGGSDTVAFLVQKNGAWVVAADGPTGDAAKIIPSDFPVSMLRSWEDKRNPAAPRDPASPTTRAPGAGPRPTPHVCRGEGGDVIKCESTIPETTTTTRPPTTRPPTTPPPPVTTPAPPTTFSPFCLENPLDPSCSGGKP